jgi:hypothetical protein
MSLVARAVGPQSKIARERVDHTLAVLGTHTGNDTATHNRSGFSLAYLNMKLALGWYGRLTNAFAATFFPDEVTGAISSKSSSWSASKTS